MTRKTTLLLATALGTTANAARADVVPAAPRTLASGAPACGNVMFKQPDPPPCATVRVIADLADAVGQLLTEVVPARLRP
ncbi:MAG TPA: hypothetical protein VFQ53_28710 [Kofleriaceae bacterium]|nr:hypothetical protein [Kofleriaceae bacterium]